MSVIHKTTMSPTKLELLAGWLPDQAWFDGPTDRLVRAGGFRLDDPDGEVGIELMVLGTGDVAYLVPMTYRGAPLAGGEHALIGTAQHGVLGARWIYDGEHDPVLRAQLAALLNGTVLAQAQAESHTVDPTVQVRPVPDVGTVELRRLLTEDEPPPAAGYVSVQWQRPDGSVARGIVATAGRQPAVPLRA
jgi:hypothetical protein